VRWRRRIWNVAHIAQPVAKHPVAETIEGHIKPYFAMGRPSHSPSCSTISSWAWSSAIRALPSHAAGGNPMPAEQREKQLGQHQRGAKTGRASAAVFAMALHVAAGKLYACDSDLLGRPVDESVFAPTCWPRDTAPPRKRRRPPPPPFRPVRRIQERRRGVRFKYERAKIRRMI